LRPSNILLNAKYQPLITEWGVSRLAACGAGAGTEGLGTYLYSAPEIWTGFYSTRKIDVFAFGLILYELLVGSSVFPRDASRILLFDMQVKGTRPTIPDAVSKPVRSLIEHCWSVVPDDRPTFDEIFRQLTLCKFAFFEDVNLHTINDYISEATRRIADP
jgi:serine/threonine-protein kinase